MMLFASTNRGNGIPANGQILAISSYSALFSLMGTTYGGNGTTTFALPDMRPVTPDNMTWYICDQGVFPNVR
jgi:microcystin-dependent protein